MIQRPMARSHRLIKRRKKTLLMKGGWIDVLKSFALALKGTGLGVGAEEKVVKLRRNGLAGGRGQILIAVIA